MPSGRPPSTTGSRRTACRRISRTAVTSSSSGPTHTGERVHTDWTLTVSGSAPSATARRVMSRSVSTPISWSPRATSTSPMSWARISWAASTSEASGRTAATPAVMTSRTYRAIAVRLVSVSAPSRRSTPPRPVHAETGGVWGG